MPIPDQRRYLTPRQRIAASVATVCCGIAAVTVSVYEGTIFKAYPDPVLGWKAPTACTGHMDPNMDRNARFTADECRELLETDLRDHYNGIAKSSCIGDVPMPDHQLAAWLSLSFNIGVTNFCKSSIPAKLKAGDAIAACNTIKQFRFVGGKDCALAQHNCRGIVRRREAEWKLCVGDMT